MKTIYHEGYKFTEVPRDQAVAMQTVGKQVYWIDNVNLNPNPATGKVSDTLYDSDTFWIIQDD